MVIPNWNGADRLRKLLESLAGQSRPVDQVIVVDNGSTDDSAAVAQGAGASVIGLKSNTGFSHAVNHGIRAADADWIGILNNDVRLEPTWLENLLGKAEAGHAGLRRASSWTPPAAVRSTVHRAILRGGGAWRCGHGRVDPPVWNQGREICFAPLTAAILKAPLFERVGVLDEEFESYLKILTLGSVALLPVLAASMFRRR